MKITLVLRNTTPVFSATPGSDRISTTGEINPPGRNGMPLTRTRKMNIPANVGGDLLKPVPVPVVPGNSMRSLLRRSILNNLIVPQLEGRDKLSIGAYAAAFSGNATGRPEGVATFDDIVATRSHVFLGLFGGGPRMIEGRLSVDTLYPVHPHSTRAIGAGYEERMVSGDITNIVWMRRVDPILANREESAQNVIDGGRQALTQWAIDAMDSASAKRSKKEKEVEPEGDEARGLKAFNAHEVVIPGIDWVLRLNLDKPTPAQVGMVLAGIQKMPELSIAGGHSKGYGQFEIQDITLDGEWVWDGAQYVDSEAIAGYFDAMAEALEDLKGQDFEDFITSKAGKKDGDS